MSYVDEFIDYDFEDDFEENDEEELEFFEYSRIENATAKAVLFSTRKGNVWIPKSVIRKHDKEERVIEYPDWFEITFRKNT